MKILNKLKQVHFHLRYNNIKTIKFEQCIAKKYFNSNEPSESTQKEMNYKSEILKILFNNNIKHKKVPCFEVFSSQIEILNRPFDYYLAIIVITPIFIMFNSNLKKLIRSAQFRITISSLYIGTGQMEEFIVEELFKAIKENPELKVTIVLDRGRGKYIIIS